MGIEANLHAIKCLNQHKNGEDFSLNTSDFAVDFTALVGEKVRMISQVSLTWFSEATYGDEWYIDAGEITRTTGNFTDDGFIVGQSFQFYADWQARLGAPEEFTATIDSIVLGGLGMTFTVTSGSQATGVPAALSTVNVGIWADLEDTPEDGPTALFFRWNLLPNGDPFSTTSLMSDETQSYYGTGLTTIPTTLQPEGTLQGWVNGQCTAEKEATVYDKNHLTYKVTHDFIVNPYWLAGWLSYLQAGTKPPLYQQGVSLSYQFEYEFRQGLTQTTNSKTVTFSTQQGMTGYFGESFGGIQAGYSVGSASYTDTASSDAQTGLQKYAKTTASFRLEKTSGSFISGQKIGVYVSYLPSSSSQYQQTLTTFTENFLFESAFHTEGTSPTIDAGIIKRCFSALSSGGIDISIDIEYTAAQQLKINAGDNFAIWVVVENSALTAPNSDRCVLLVAASEYVVAQNVSGLATWGKFDILTHQLTYLSDAGLSAAVDLWDEDGFLVDWEFSIDTSKNTLIKGLRFELSAYNSSTGESFPLDSYDYNLGGVILQGGIPQLNIDTSRGYALKSGDQFNFVKVENSSFSSPDQTYKGAFAQKIKWQEWVQNLGVDTVFYDNTEPQNNLNNKSDNYSGLNGYEIHVTATLELSGDDQNGQAGVGTEIKRSSVLNIRDYGVSDTTWSGTIYTLDPDTLSDLGGNILGNKDTLFRVVWNETASIANVYAIHRIEKTGDPSGGIKELSSMNPPPPSGNILKPKAGETQTTLAIVGSDIHSECLIDYTQIDPNAQYNLSARIERYIDAANFSVTFPDCNARILSTYSGGTVTDIQYEFYIGATLVDTQNTLLTTYDWIPASLYASESVRIVQTITLSAGGPVVSESTIAFPAFAGCFVQFSSNNGASDTFDPSVVDGAAESYWRFPDDIVRVGDDQTVVGSAAGFDGTTKQVRYFCTDYSTLSLIRLSEDKIVGLLDLSLLTSVTTIEAEINAGQSSVVLPAITSNLVKLDLDNCDLSGTIDFSVFGAFFGGEIYFDDNTNLTTVINPVSSRAISAYRGRDCNLTGTINISTLTGIIDFVISRNPNLTNITTGTHANNWAKFFAEDCDLTGTLDVSGYSGLGGEFLVSGNPNLTQINNPTSSQAFTEYDASGCGLTSWNGSGLTGLAGILNLSANASCLTIINPASSGSITEYRANNTGIGTLDVSGLTLSGIFTVADCGSLSSLALPSSSGTIDILSIRGCDLGYVDITGLTFASDCEINSQNNGMTAAEVNQILVDLNSTLPTTGTGVIDIGGTNAAPDGSSGGFDGSAAKTALEGKGYTVTTS